MYTVWQLRTTAFAPTSLAAIGRLAVRRQLKLNHYRGQSLPRTLVDFHADGGDGLGGDDQVPVPTEPLHRALARVIPAGQAIVLWSMTRDGHGWLFHEDAQILTNAGVVAGFSITRRANAASHLERDRIRRQWAAGVFAAARRHGMVAELGCFPYDPLDPA